MTSFQNFQFLEFQTIITPDREIPRHCRHIFDGSPVVSLACQQILRFVLVVCTYVRREKVLSLVFMHSPVTCSASVQPKRFWIEEETTFSPGVYTRNTILALGDRIALRFEWWNSKILEMTALNLKIKPNADYNYWSAIHKWTRLSSGKRNVCQPEYGAKT